MKITLTFEEIIAALSDSTGEKINHVLGPDQNDAYFTVKTPEGEVQDVEDIEFTIIYSDNKSV